LAGGLCGGQAGLPRGTGETAAQVLPRYSVANHVALWPISNAGSLSFTVDKKPKTKCARTSLYEMQYRLVSKNTYMFTI